MYSRDFGGVKSDGQLREYNDRMQRQYESREQAEAEEYCEPERTGEIKKESKGIFDSLKTSFGFDFLKNIKIDDLVLIGIGLLILFGKEEHNILLLILIALLVIL